MQKSGELFPCMASQDENIVSIGDRLYIKFIDLAAGKIAYYNNDVLIKHVDLSDKVAKKIFIVEAVEAGATKYLLAQALQISCQTIHNYMESKKYFGIEGLIYSYNSSKSKSLYKQRNENADKIHIGNKARKLEQIRKQGAGKKLQAICTVLWRSVKKYRTGGSTV